MVEGKINVNATLVLIGKIRTPYKLLEDCPRNIDPDGPVCELEIDESYREGMAGLLPGRKILVLYWLEKADRAALQLEPRDEFGPCGVFGLRSPHRPNPIGAAVVRVEAIEGRRILVKGMDCLDGTPLLDIKPAIQKELDGL